MRKITVDLIFVIGIVLMFLLITPLLFHMGLVPFSPDNYEKETITFTDCDNQVKTEMDVLVSDTPLKRYSGLSDKKLSSGEGMIFKYDNESDYTIGMRQMDYPLEVVYIHENGSINSIYNLDSPSNILEYYYSYETVQDTGKYIVETNSEWSNRNNVSESDCLEFAENPN